MRENRLRINTASTRTILLTLNRWRKLARLATTLVIYLTAVVLAEILIASNVAWLGLPLNVLVLLSLLLLGAGASDEAERPLLWGLALVPLMRIISLSLPLASFPVLYGYAIVSVPLVAGTIVAARAIGYSHRDLGLMLQFRNLPSIILMVPLGFLLGAVEYALLRQPPLSSRLALDEIWMPALVLILSIGLTEELIFRGLLQRAALRLLGPWGLVYVSAIFAALHIGYLSLPNLVLVFATGLFFAGIAWRTGSIVGVTLAHSSISVSALLIAPFLLARWL